MEHNKYSKIMNLEKMLILCLIPILFLSGNIINAQDYFDTKGNDFWLAFTPNYHMNKFSTTNQAKYGDSLYIFIAADEPTSGTITYTDLSNKTYTHNFSITNINKIYTFQVSFYNFELLGYNDMGDTWAQNNSEKIAYQSFHIETVKEVTVYAHSQAVTSSDAFLVLPTDGLGKEYFIMSYNSDGSTSGFVVSTSSTPSQFAIVATEDNTEVTILPKTETYIYGLNQQSVKMSKGSVFLVQAKITTTKLNGDLTGTQVISNKPIAIFAGQQRAVIPYTDFTDGSRDFIVEQVLPVQSWGENAFLIPFESNSTITTMGDDLYRILAAYDNTEVFINNIKVVELNKGGFFQGELTEAAKIEANKPISVAQFKKSSANSHTARNQADPFMMMIPPEEQFMKSYRFNNTQSMEYSTSGYFEVYDYQYVSVVAPNSAINTIKLDGNNVNASNFKPIPSSNYSYSNIKVTDGVHFIEADEKIGIYVYGYGVRNSYGYVGGMSLKPIDLIPPEISYNIDCFSLKGFIYDSTSGDTGIKEVSSETGYWDNVQVNIDKFVPYPDSVKFSAKLNDYRYDGSFKITAKDSMDLTTETEISIPGFTVGLLSQEVVATPPKQQIKTAIGKEYCFDIQIHNYGKFPQQINNILFSHSSMFKINQTIPFTILPDEVKNIQVCFYSDTELSIKDSIVITSPCINKNLLYLDLDVITDRNNPDYGITGDSCNTTFQLIISDSTSVDFGIKAVDLVYSSNINIDYIIKSAKVYKLILKIPDPKQDAFYMFSIIDSADNNIIIEDTIPGYAISLPQMSSTNNRISLGKTSLGELVCDSIEIKNNGKSVYTFNNFYLTGNILFSYPPSQLPFEVNPGESRWLHICFRPLIAREESYLDTLIIGNPCNYESVILVGFAEELIKLADSRCEVPLILTTTQVPSGFILGEPIPNPIISTSKIIFGVPITETYQLIIYDSFGNIKKIYEPKEYQPGIYDFIINADDFSSGIYFLRFKSKSIDKNIPLLILN